MSKGMENFRQAARELFGDDSSPRASAAPEPEPVEEKKPLFRSGQSAPSEPRNERVVSFSQAASSEGAAASSYEAAPEPPSSFASDSRSRDLTAYDPPKEISVISKGTVIRGRVSTDGHLEVRGRVDGDVSAEGNVRISGKVSGSVQGDNIELLSTRIRGNLSATSGIMVNSESVVVGDIKTDYIIFDGKLKGDLNATDSVTLNHNAYLVGNITAQAVSIDSGAVINGIIKTTTTTNTNEDSVFDFN